MLPTTAIKFAVLGSLIFAGAPAGNNQPPPLTPTPTVKIDPICPDAPAVSFFFFNRTEAGVFHKGHQQVNKTRATVGIQGRGPAAKLSRG